MADDKSKTGKADSDRVNLHEDYEIEALVKKFGASADVVRAAIKKAGPMRKDVEAELSKK
ncbi:hypothetical protein BH10PSE17_BH10PSE17_25010 [soil metagenome]